MQNTLRTNTWSSCLRLTLAAMTPATTTKKIKKSPPRLAKPPTFTSRRPSTLRSLPPNEAETTAATATVKAGVKNAAVVIQRTEPSGGRLGQTAAK